MRFCFLLSLLCAYSCLNIPTIIYAQSASCEELRCASCRNDRVLRSCRRFCLAFCAKSILPNFFALRNRLSPPFARETSKETGTERQVIHSEPRELPTVLRTQPVRLRTEKPSVRKPVRVTLAPARTRTRHPTQSVSPKSYSAPPTTPKRTRPPTQPLTTKNSVPPTPRPSTETTTKHLQIILLPKNAVRKYLKVQTAQNLQIPQSNGDRVRAISKQSTRPVVTESKLQDSGRKPSGFQPLFPKWNLDQNIGFGPVPTVPPQPISQSTVPPKPISQRSFTELLPPDEKFLQCCVENKDIPPPCYTLCSFENLNIENVLAASLFWGCPWTAALPLLKCGSEGDDLRACCERKGVHSHCLTYCHPTLNFPGGNSMQCLNMVNPLRECFRENSLRKH